MTTTRVNFAAFLVLAVSGSAIPLAFASPPAPPGTITTYEGPVTTIVGYDTPNVYLPVVTASAEPPAPATTIVVESPPPMSQTIPEIIAASAQNYGIDPALWAAIAWCESRNDPNARNPSGASGLFQQMPQYWPARAAAAGWGGADIFDPVANANVSAWLYTQSGTSPWASSRSCWG